MILIGRSFKPQRGKFTPEKASKIIFQSLVSNPNGVNLHAVFEWFFFVKNAVSNPNGVNLHTFKEIINLEYDRFKPQRGKFTPNIPSSIAIIVLVSNPNGVNLHRRYDPNQYFHFCFKPQRGKFTRRGARERVKNANGFKPQRGKFTPSCERYRYLWNLSVSNPNGVNLHTIDIEKNLMKKRFKPQRGKFTRQAQHKPPFKQRISNPNGVNLPNTKTLIFRAIYDKSLYF